MSEIPGSASACVMIDLLGPFEVSVNGTPAEIRGHNRKVLLAALAVHMYTPLAAEDLARLVWSDVLPPTFRQQLHKKVHVLREHLGPGALLTREPGYVLNPALCDTDLRRFCWHVEQARELRAQERLKEAAEQFRAALGLWRGPVLTGLRCAGMSAIVSELDEERLSVIEECVDVELALGRHAEIVVSTAANARRHPHRERFTGQLMLALHRCGRTVEALDTFDRFRVKLAKDLGTTPSTQLAKLHESLIEENDEASLSRHPGAIAGNAQAVPAIVDAVAPAQLPMDVPGFVGRVKELRALDHLTSVRGHAVVAISGPAGAGKTALAVRWAHRSAPRFPDGQLYADLRGHASGAAVTPSEVLAWFVRALGGEPQRLPADTAGRVNVYRSLVSGRRILVVLDNAANEEQVRPLLPGGALCKVIVTSRHSVRGLVAFDDAAAVDVDALAPADAHALVHRALGQRVPADEHERVAELAALCGRLPLVLGVAAAGVARTSGSLAGVITGFAGAGRRARPPVRGGRVDGTPAFDLSYAQLPKDAARAFRSLGLLSGADFTPAALAALLGGTLDNATRCLRTLESMSLVVAHDRDRYRIHDLLREYAAGLLQQGERDAALTRLLRFYLGHADAAVTLAVPGMVREPVEQAAGARPSFTSAEDALSWLDGEYRNIAESALRWAESGPRELIWRIADSLRPYFWLRACTALAVELAKAGLHAATKDLDVTGQAAMHCALGMAHLDADPARGIEHLATGYELHREAGNLRGMYSSRHNLGAGYRNLGHPREAARHLRRALTLAADRGYVQQWHVRDSLASALVQTGDLATALTRFEESLAHLGSSLEEPYTRTCARAADAALQLGEVPRARELMERANATVNTTRAERWHLDVLGAKAKFLRDTGRSIEALNTAQQLAALAKRTRVADHFYVALVVTGDVLQHLGRAQDAVAVLKKARDRPWGPVDLFHRSAVTISLARAEWQAGDRKSATEHASEVLEVAGERGLAVLQGRAYTVLSVLSGPDAAVELLDEAVAIHARTGHLLGRAEALALLAHHLPARAEEYHCYVREIFEIYTRRPDHAPAGVLVPSRFEPCGRPECDEGWHESIN